MRWRRAALLIAWVCAAGWGIYYLISPDTRTESFIFDAVLHFAIGYAWARALMQPQYSMLFALLAISLSGVYTRLAVGMGTGEIYVAWAGPLAALALADFSTLRTSLYSVAAFALGFVALFWLTP